MPHYQRDGASLYYEEYGSGFPLLLVAPGGMNSAIAFWSRMPFNPIEQFQREFRVIAMDQRNCGQSAGPLDTEDPWGAYAADQLALLDHLGINRYLAMGCCIGCSYLLKQIERAPGRMVAGVLEQPIGLVESNVQVFQDRIWRPWGEELASRRDDISMDEVLEFGNAMWDGEFVFSVPRASLSSIVTPLLVLAGNDAAHPTSVSIELTSLLPNAQLLEDWRSPEELPVAIDTVRSFLKTHTAE